MTKQKIGLIIFITGILLAVILGGVASYSVNSAFRDSTIAEASETMWKIPGFWFFLWAFGVPLGAILAGVGALIYSKAKASTTWLFGLGTFLTFVLVSVALPVKKHIPILFGIGGTLILLFFFGIVWSWAKKRMTLKNNEKTAADLQLTGYTFLLIAMWFICGELGGQFLKAFEGDTGSPIKVMIYLVLGWLFLFLGHYKSTKPIE